jgi:proliferating cell nuclear antigen
MIVRLDDPSLFSKAIDVISELVTEVKIKFNEYGMNITAIDPANVAMVRFKIPKSSFSKFEAENDVLGINLDNLKKVLRRAGSSTPLTLEKKENLLEIQIQGKIKRNFTMTLLDLDSQDKEMPALEYSSKVEISSEDLNSAIEDSSVVSDSCAFIVKDNFFIVESRGLDSARAEFSTDEVKIEGEDCKSKYSIEYLQKFMKAAKMTDKLILNFASDHPLKMDIKTEVLEMNFLLAPRVETDD